MGNIQYAKDFERLPSIAGSIRVGRLKSIRRGATYRYEKCFAALNVEKSSLTVYSKGGRELLSRFSMKDTEIQEVHSRPRRDINLISDGVCWMRLRTEISEYKTWLRLLRQASRRNYEIETEGILGDLLGFSLSATDTKTNDASSPAPSCNVSEDEIERDAVTELEENERRRTTSLKERAPSKIDPTEQVECGVCLESVPSGSTMGLATCSHRFCRDCWRAAIERAVRAGRAAVNLTCLRAGCGCRVLPNFVRRVLGDDASAIWRRYRRFLVLNYVDRRRHVLVRCPNPACERILRRQQQRGVSSDDEDDQREAKSDNASTIDSKQVDTCVVCSCGARFCFDCLQPDHAPVACEVAREWDRMERALNADGRGRVVADIQSQNWMRTHCRPCPQCAVPVYKDPTKEGCIHMTCPEASGGCGFEFCWWCMGPWHGGPYFGVGGLPGESRPCRNYLKDQKVANLKLQRLWSKKTPGTEAARFERRVATIAAVRDRHKDTAQRLREGLRTFFVRVARALERKPHGGGAYDLFRAPSASSVRQSSGHDDLRERVGSVSDANVEWRTELARFESAMYVSLNDLCRCWRCEEWVLVADFFVSTDETDDSVDVVRHATDDEDPSRVLVKTVAAAIRCESRILRRQIEAAALLSTEWIRRGHEAVLLRGLTNHRMILCDTTRRIHELLRRSREMLTFVVTTRVSTTDPSSSCCYLCGTTYKNSSASCDLCRSPRLQQAASRTMCAFVSNNVSTAQRLGRYLLYANRARERMEEEATPMKNMQQKLWVPGTCPACTFHNDRNARRCVMCNGKIPKRAPKGWREA